MNKVILPKEWNSPDKPPCNDNSVVVLLKDGTVTGAFWHYGTWEPVGVDPTYDMSGVMLQDDVVGWAEISHQ